MTLFAKTRHKEKVKNALYNAFYNVLSVRCNALQSVANVSQRFTNGPVNTSPMNSTPSQQFPQRFVIALFSVNFLPCCSDSVILFTLCPMSNNYCGVVKTKQKKTMELVPKVKLLYHGLRETTLGYSVRNILSANFAFEYFITVCYM